MLTSLDLLILVFIGFAFAVLVSVCLMFLIKNRIVRRVCLYISIVIGIIMAFLGYMISSGMFPMQTATAMMTALASVGALVFDIVGRKNDKLFLVARIIAAASVAVGFINAFLI